MAFHSRLPSSSKTRTARTCHRRHKGLVLLRNPYHSGQPRWCLLPTGCRNPCQIECPPPRSCRGGGRADERAGLGVVSLRAAAGGPPRTAEERAWLWTGQGFDCPRFGSAGSEWSAKRSTLKPCQSKTPVAGPVRGRAQILLSGRNPLSARWKSSTRHVGFEMSAARAQVRLQLNTKVQFLDTSRSTSFGCTVGFCHPMPLDVSVEDQDQDQNQHGLSTSRAGPRGGSDSVLRIGARPYRQSFSRSWRPGGQQPPRGGPGGLGPRGLVVRGFNTRPPSENQQTGYKIWADKWSLANSPKPSRCCRHNTDTSLATFASLIKPPTRPPGKTSALHAAIG